MESHALSQSPSSSYSHIGKPTGAQFLASLTGTPADYTNMTVLPAISTTLKPSELTIISATLHIKALPLKRLPIIAGWSRALIDSWRIICDDFADYFNNTMDAYDTSCPESCVLFTNACIAYFAGARASAPV